MAKIYDFNRFKSPVDEVDEDKFDKLLESGGKLEEYEKYLENKYTGLELSEDESQRIYASIMHEIMRKTNSKNQQVDTDNILNKLFKDE
ncbi:MAG: hypothetical protein LUF78_10330 [Clostridiales bacterium]|nr:hypothetical protein [Clostridiales bacterium]